MNDGDAPEASEVSVESLQVPALKVSGELGAWSTPLK
jgi:hypothetical protein